MANKQIEDFLGSVEPEAEPPVVEEAAPPEPVAEAAPEPEAKAPEAETEAEPEDVKGLRSALVAERAKRQDYKGERDRLQGEVAAMKAQIEAQAKVQPSALPPQQAPVPQYVPPMAPPNPAEDPQGFYAWHEHTLFNERCNSSEIALTRAVGKEDVAAKMDLFKQAAAANPSLAIELRKQADPYGWAYDEGKKYQFLKEAGNDPDAFRTKLRAEIEAEVRAQMEAEFANAPMSGVPAAGPRLPASLGTARSAAPRGEAPSAPGFEDIFSRARKKA